MFSSVSIQKAFTQYFASLQAPRHYCPYNTYVIISTGSPFDRNMLRQKCVLIMNFISERWTHSVLILHACTELDQNNVHNLQNDLK